MKDGQRATGNATPEPANRLVAGLLSILPGAGHMYLGLLGKGFSLMGIYFTLVFVVILYSSSTAMYWMTAYLVPTISVLFLSYAVFDALAIAGARRDGRGREPGDDPVMTVVWERVLLNRRTFGWVLLAAGGIGLLALAARPLDALVRDRLGIDLPIMSLVMPAILLAVGASLLRKGRRGS
jgi:TM2 domain-containing membrane protein YozV